MDAPSLRAVTRDQTAAVEVLTSMGGGTLSYAELEERGVPRPAVVCYELAAAGWPIEPGIAPDPSGGSSHRGVRMVRVPTLESPLRERQSLRDALSGLRRLWGGPIS